MSAEVTMVIAYMAMTRDIASETNIKKYTNENTEAPVARVRMTKSEILNRGEDSVQLPE